MKPKPKTYKRGGALERYELYRSPRWRRMRAAHLKQHPQCVVCNARANTVDHALGHGADWRLNFWDQATWQSMCARCHSLKSGNEHKLKWSRGPRMAGGAVAEKSRGLCDPASPTAHNIRVKKSALAMAEKLLSRPRSSPSTLEEP